MSLIFSGLLVCTCAQPPEEIEQVRPDRVEIHVGESFIFQYHFWGYAGSSGYVRLVPLMDLRDDRWLEAFGTYFTSTSENPTIASVRDLTVRGISPGTTRVHIGQAAVGAGGRVSEGDWAEVVVLPSR